MKIDREHYNDGTQTQIEPHIIPIVKDLLLKFEPKLIIEFGTFYGGFTKYLSEWFTKIPIFTIDYAFRISSNDYKKFIRTRKNVSFYLTRNLFENDFVIPMILSLPIKKFLLCDNGQKEDEVRLYSGFLRPGDLLGIHDWGTEVNPENVKCALNEFDEHKFNDLYKNSSWFRFFIKKQRFGNDNILREKEPK